MTTMKRERLPTGTLGRLDDIVFMNNSLPNMLMSIFALLVIPNFNQLMEYAPWPIGRPYDGGFRYNCMVLKVRTSSQYPKVKTLWNSVDVGGFRRWKSHKSWLQHWRRNLWGDLDSFPVLVAQVLHEIWLSHLYCVSWFFKMPTFCPLCEIAAPVRKVTIRGLCEQSIFDKWDKFLIHVYLN